MRFPGGYYVRDDRRHGWVFVVFAVLLILLVLVLSYAGYLHRCTWMCDDRHHCNAVCYLTGNHSWGMPRRH